MSISIQAKTDYSELFNSINGNSSSSNLLSQINLSDYNSIKSGTYHKLLKTYYSEKASEKASEKTTENTTVKASEKTSETASVKASDKKTSNSASSNQEESALEKAMNTEATRKAATTYTASGVKTTGSVATTGLNISDLI